MKARLTRGAALLPVLAALAVNAVAHGRWMLAALVGGGLLLALALAFRLGAPGRGRRALVASAGAVVGLALFFFAPPPPGPVPPELLSPLCAALMGTSALEALSGRHRASWLYAWLLAVLSANAAPSPQLMWALAALAAFSLLALGLEAGVRSAWGISAFLLFALGAAALGVAAHRVILGSEGWLMETVFRLTSRSAPTSLQPQSIELPARVNAPLSEEPLMELSGRAPRYLRTAVLDRFDGRRWTTSAALATRKLRLPGGEGEPLGLSLFGPSDEALPAPAGVRSVWGASVEARGGWILSAPDAAGSTVTFLRAEEQLFAEAAAPEDTALPEEVRAQLSGLADSLLGAERDPRAQAASLQRHFAEGFRYSLAVDLRGQGHPLAVLVREKRPAFCTYFASAMVALLRARDVPARMVAGFAMGEANPLTGRTLVRSRDAHAWVEVYLPGEGRWEAFDPTPWQSRDGALAIPRDRGFLTQAWEAVVAGSRRLWAALRYRPGESLLAALGSPWTWGGVGGGALVVFGRRRLKRGPRSREAALNFPLDPATRRAYRRYQTILKTAGVAPGMSETDEEVLARLRTVASPGLADAAAQFIQVFQRARFRALEEAPLAQSLASLEAALRPSAPDLS